MANGYPLDKNEPNGLRDGLTASPGLSLVSLSADSGPTRAFWRATSFCIFAACRLDVALMPAALGLALVLRRAAYMIALIHIKKTAGKSLKHIMRCAFGVRHCDVKRWQARDETFSAADLRRVQRVHPGLKSLAGHSIRSYSDIADRAADLRLYTFVRDPIKRCISEYQYSVAMGRCEPGSFASWIDKPAYRNVQVQSLGGSNDVDAAIRQIDDRIAFVGMMEHFDESLALMQGLMDLPWFTPLHRRVNAASDHAIRDAILADADAMNAVRRANEADVALFEHVARVVFPRQRKRASRTQVSVDGFKAAVAAEPRQFNCQFFANGAYRYLVYKPSVSAYRLCNSAA